MSETLDCEVEYALVNGLDPDWYVRTLTVEPEPDFAALQELFARMWSLCSVNCGSLIQERKP